MEEFDLYADLINVENDRSHEVSASNLTHDLFDECLASHLHEPIATPKQEIISKPVPNIEAERLKAELKKLTRVNKYMKYNLTLLYKTARSIISAKDKELTSLRQKYDAICFRRSEIANFSQPRIPDNVQCVAERKPNQTFLSATQALPSSKSLVEDKSKLSQYLGLASNSSRKRPAAVISQTENIKRLRACNEPENQNEISKFTGDCNELPSSTSEASDRTSNLYKPTSQSNIKRKTPQKTPTKVLMANRIVKNSKARLSGSPRKLFSPTKSAANSKRNEHVKRTIAVDSHVRNSGFRNESGFHNKKVVKRVCSPPDNRVISPTPPVSLAPSFMTLPHRTSSPSVNGDKYNQRNSGVIRRGPRTPSPPALSDSAVIATRRNLDQCSSLPSGDNLAGVGVSNHSRTLSPRRCAKNQSPSGERNTSLHHKRPVSSPVSRDRIPPRGHRFSSNRNSDMTRRVRNRSPLPQGSREYNRSQSNNERTEHRVFREVSKSSRDDQERQRVSSNYRERRDQSDRVSSVRSNTSRRTDKAPSSSSLSSINRTDAGVKANGFQERNKCVRAERSYTPPLSEHPSALQARKQTTNVTLPVVKPRDLDNATVCVAPLKERNGIIIKEHEEGEVLSD